MTFTYRDGIAVVKLIVYFPYLAAAIMVSVRHGLQKSSGWIFLVTFCMIRIISGCSQLATINSTSSTPSTIAAVTDSLGLSALLLSSVGLISRAYYSILKIPWSLIFGMTVLKFPIALAGVGAILDIVAATSAKSLEDVDNQPTLKIGLILYMVTYIIILLLTIFAAILSSYTGRGERSLIWAVALALPFLLIRLIYAIVSAFGHDSKFNMVTGSETIVLFMCVIEEFAIIAIYTITGIKLSSVPEGEADGPASKLMYRAGRGDFGTGKLGLLSFAFAGISAFSKSDSEKKHSPSSSQPRSSRRPNSHSRSTHRSRSVSYRPSDERRSGSAHRPRGPEHRAGSSYHSAAGPIYHPVPDYQQNYQYRSGPNDVPRPF